MCGIIGYITNPGKQAKALSLSTLRHRGPDANGEWRSVGGEVWLGHTRLAILDLSTLGAQPMQDESNGNTIIFNGEIYNHATLRKELEELGIKFKGQSDTETLLRGFSVWRTALFSRLRGMFAFAIYNHASRSVILCRDRFGIKPLYLGRIPDGSLAFASEVRPLIPVTGRNLSTEGLAAYLSRGACPHHKLLFENICEFPAGCWLEIVPGKGHLTPCRYWPLEYEPTLLEDCSDSLPNDPIKKVRKLLEDSVKSHLQADVPLACFLSGGIDSSVLVALAANQLGGENLSTFSVGFDEPEFDESRFAQEISDLYRTKHHHIRLSNVDKLTFFEQGLQAMDLPSIDGINTYVISHFVSTAGYKVVLSGLGADEIFGGYPIFRDFWLVSAIAATPLPLRQLILMAGRGQHLFSDVPHTKSGEELSCWWRRVWSGQMLKHYGFPVAKYVSEPQPELQDAMGELSWGEVSHYMRDTLLRDSDVMSMAHSLEIRVPFLDNELVNFVMNLPAKLKFDPKVPKKLLLESTKDLIPNTVWNRPKMGFALPMREWMLGPLRDRCYSSLKILVDEGLFSSRQIENLWKSFTLNKGHWSTTWATVVLGRYLETYK